MADTTDRVGRANRRAHELADTFGSALVGGFHVLALFAIGATIVWAAVFEFLKMVGQGHATVEDILLLFIYLELGADGLNRTPASADALAATRRELVLRPVRLRPAPSASS